MIPGLNIQDLLEHSILDSMGLLDEQEQARFELAFRAAPAPVQAQIRAEQVRLAHIDALLPDVAPPAGLRAAVVDAIRREQEAMRSDSRDLQPMPAMIRSTRVSPLWRAASLGLLAASITLGIVTFQLIGQTEQTMKQLQGEAILAKLGEKFGPGFVQDVLFKRDTTRVVLASHQGSPRGEASLFMNPEWKHAKFFTNSMASPEGKNFRIAVVDENGKIVRVLKEFSSRGGLESIDVNIAKDVTGDIAVLVANSAGTDSIVCKGTIPSRG